MLGHGLDWILLEFFSNLVILWFCDSAGTTDCSSKWSWAWAGNTFLLGPGSKAQSTGKWSWVEAGFAACSELCPGQALGQGTQQGPLDWHCSFHKWTWSWLLGAKLGKFCEAERKVYYNEFLVLCYSNLHILNWWIPSDWSREFQCQLVWKRLGFVCANTCSCVDPTGIKSLQNSQLIYTCRGNLNSKKGLPKPWKFILE